MKKNSVVACIVILLSVSALYAASGGPVEDLQLIRNFHSSINKGDVYQIMQYACEAQKAIKQGNFGVVPDEVELLTSKFPWHGLELVQIKKLSGYYEVQLKGKDGTEKKNVTLGKEEGVDCIYFTK